MPMYFTHIISFKLCATLGGMYNSQFTEEETEGQRFRDLTPATEQ